MQSVPLPVAILTQASTALALILCFCPQSIAAMPKTKAWPYKISNQKTKAKAKAKAPVQRRLGPHKAIGLMIYDPCMPGGGPCLMVAKMNETLSDLVFAFREEDSPSLGEVTELYFTTLEGKLLPMKTKVAKLMQDGLISDGSEVKIEVRLWVPL